jgi:hypothetical protein
MRKTITRTIVSTTIMSATVRVVNGKVTSSDNAPLTINGVIDDDKALKEVQKAYGKINQYVILGRLETNDIYEISVDDFMKYATKVEAPKEEVKEVTKTE